jgi:hypothetical protein
MFLRQNYNVGYLFYNFVEFFQKPFHIDYWLYHFLGDKKMEKRYGKNEAGLKSDGEYEIVFIQEWC